MEISIYDDIVAVSYTKWLWQSVISLLGDLGIGDIYRSNTFWQIVAVSLISIAEGTLCPVSSVTPNNFMQNVPGVQFNFLKFILFLHIIFVFSHTYLCFFFVSDLYCVFCFCLNTWIWSLLNLVWHNVYPSKIQCHKCNELRPTIKACEWFLGVTIAPTQVSRTHTDETEKEKAKT